MLKKKLQKLIKAPWKAVGLALTVVISVKVVKKWLQGENLPVLPRAVDADLVGMHNDLAGKLFYYVDRKEEGTPLLLIHSINAAPSTFEVKPLFNHYRGSRPVYSLELPGFGFSERNPERTYLPGTYRQAILQLVEEEIKAPVDVIALSLGSEFVTAAAHIKPELFRSITLISPTGMMDREIDLPGEKIRGFLNFPLWSQPLFNLVSSRPSINYYANQSFVGDAPAEFLDYAYATSHQPGAKHAPFFFLSGQLFSNHIRQEVYEQLTVPTMVIYDEDPNVSFEMLPDLLSKNEKWQAEQLVPSRGLPHWEMLPETTALLEKFWSNID